MPRAQSIQSVRLNDKANKANTHPDLLAQQVASLECENQKLRQLSEYRAVTLAHLAHELRTPLTSILGFSEILLSQEQLTDTQRNFCERIQSSALQLQRLLSQVAELSRLRISPDDVSTPS